jgi:hypothetical protein
MAGHKRQFGCQFGTDYDTMILQLSAKDVQCSKSNPVASQRIPALPFAAIAANGCLTS